MSAAGSSDTSSDDTDPTAGADASDDSTPSSTVLCTIMNNGDGTFTLIDGDEDDYTGDDSSAGADAGGDGSDDSAGAGEGAEGSPPAAGGVAASPKGQEFDSPGPLLKAVLDLVKTAQESSGGSDEDNFSAGFNGDKSSTPKS